MLNKLLFRQPGGKRLIRPDAQDVNKMLNFETDDETDADSIFSRQTSRDDCLDFDDEDEGDGFDGVGRNEDGRNKGVARGMRYCRLTCSSHTCILIH